MNDAVVFDRVTFRYPEAAQDALHDLSLGIPEAALVLVVGPTGSGKSTLLRAINGLVPHFTGGQFSGDVTVDGRNTLAVAPRQLADVVAFVPQSPDASFVVDRVEDELAYALENLGVEPSVMRRRVEETLDLLDLEPLRGRSVRTLSGGERQRVAIAAALTPGARVLVLDEPTSQLDPQGAEDVLAALHRMVHELGITVVLAEHRLERVVAAADVAIGCRSGSATLGNVSDVISELELGPPVARLARRVGWRPVPLTVREARRKTDGLQLRPLQGARRPRGRGIVAASGLSAVYDDGAVLKNIDLRLHAGETVALMGRNGSGKTTLLRCLTGLHPPLSGSVTVDGERPRPGDNVAFAPQDPDVVLFKERAVDEVQATIAARPSPADAMTWLRALGVEQLGDRHPRDLSAGERLLVALAAMAAVDAQVLLLDEPTRGLDVVGKQRLVAFLRESARRGRAVMLASHDVELVAEAASRVVMLAGGEVIADGDPAEVLSDSAVFSPQMTRVFGRGWLTPDQVADAVISR